MLRRFAALLMAALFLSGCGHSPAASPASASASNSPVQYYAVRGVVKELPADGKTIVIRHEEVTNFMPAMTMPFEVKDSRQLRGLKPGDHVAFRMAVGNDDAWIAEIHATNEPDAPATAITNQTAVGIAAELQRRNAAVRLVRDVDVLSLGDELPEYHFTNELGRAVSTRDFSGHPFAFTFFFTRCPMPNFCPRLSANFLAAQNALKTNPLAPANWHLFSISFDTGVDTPGELLSYAKNSKYDPEHWSFLTGDLTEISALADQVGEVFGHDETGGITHKLRTVVVDSKGRVQKIWTNNEWTGEDLARELVKGKE